MRAQKSSSLKLDLQDRKARIAIVWSRFNEAISRRLLDGARQGLLEAGVSEKNIRFFEVPGAFEVPLTAKKIALTQKFDGIICLGVVIRGDTPHFDYVCQGATQGIMQAQLDTGIPMAFGILTTDTVEQALVRAKEDSTNKGYEASKVALEMIDRLKEIDAQQ